MGKTKELVYKAKQQGGKVLVTQKSNQALFIHTISEKLPLSLNSLLTEKLANAYMKLWRELNGSGTRKAEKAPCTEIQRVVYDFNGVPLVSYRCIDRFGNGYVACGRFEQECIRIYTRYCEVVQQMGGV